MSEQLGNSMTASEVLREEQELKILTQRLLRKLDIRCITRYSLLRFPSVNRTNRILPALILLVLCSFLDRTNVGNAKLYNLEEDLGMTDAQYFQGLVAFYPLYIVSYVTFTSESLALLSADH